MEISLPVTLAVLGAAALHAVWNVMVKSGPDKDLETVAIAVGSGLIALLALPLLPAPAPASWSAPPKPRSIRSRRTGCITIACHRRRRSAVSSGRAITN